MSGLYLHIPFCRRKCPYCDFFSLPQEGEALAEYPQLLLRQLQLVQEEGAWRGPFATVFFGGGTPSLLPPEAVARLLEAVRELFGLAPQAEVSLEANPGTLDADRLAGYRAAGVNRLSLGAQALDAADLQRLGRIHSPAQVLAAVGQAREAGFTNLGLDLLFGRPGQRVEALLAELDALLALAPEHLSLYGLTVEEGTPFAAAQAAGRLTLPDEESAAQMFLALHARLEGAGYGHYEISNYARPGYACRHNLGYWERRSCLGVGAGAHSFNPRGWGERWAVPPELEGYRRVLAEGGNPARLLERFERRGAMAETLYLGLRTAAGVSEEAFRQRFGCGVAEAFPQAVRRLGGQLRRQGERWCLAPHDWLLYDHLISDFL